MTTTKKTKKILVLSTFYHPFIGGAEIAVQQIINNLKKDFNFLVLTTRTQKKLPIHFTEDGVEVIRLGLGCRWDKYFYPFLVFFKSFSLKFDLVYAVMASYAGIAALLLNVFRGRPYILNLQSGTLDLPSKQKKIRWIWPIYQAIHRRAYLIHAISNFLKDRAMRLGVPDERVVVIPNGVDLNEFQSQDGIRNAQRIITVARLEKVKGVEYVIRAMPEIIKQHPDAELIIVGNGPERKYLENLLAELNLTGVVKLLGRVVHKELPSIMNSASVLVVPSLAEGFGIVVVEGMACSLAVVGTNVGGIPDVIKDGRNGLLVGAKSHSEIAAAVNRILADNNLRSSLVYDAQKTLDTYDWQVISQKVAGLFAKF